MIWQNFNWFDYTLIAIVVLSAIISIFRGFLREAVSLASWILGVWLALKYAHLLENYFSEWVNVATVRYLLAFAILFVTSVLIGMLINLVLSFWINKSRLSLGNRFLGVIFGACRGVALVAIILLFLMNIGNIRETELLKTSLLTQQLLPLVNYLQHFLPQRMQALLNKPDQLSRVNKMR